MFTELDKEQQNFVANLKPRWKEMRTKKRHLTELSDNRISFEDLLLIGEPCMLCTVDVKTLNQGDIDYFPLYVGIAKRDDFSDEDWITLAREGGTSDLDRRLDWVFGSPLLRMIEKTDEFADGMGPKANWDSVRFYGGMEFYESDGKRALRLDVTDDTDFLLYLTIQD